MSNKLCLSKIQIYLGILYLYSLTLAILDKMCVGAGRQVKMEWDGLLYLCSLNPTPPYKQCWR